MPSGQTRSQIPQAVHLSCEKIGLKVRQDLVLFFRLEPGEDEIDILFFDGIILIYEIKCFFCRIDISRRDVFINKSLSNGFFESV